MFGLYITNNSCVGKHNACVYIIILLVASHAHIPVIPHVQSLYCIKSAMHC